MSESHGEADGVGAWPWVFGLYWTGLALWRGPEAVRLARDAIVMPPFPDWLFNYLSALLAWMLLNGLLWLVCAGLVTRRRRPVPRLGVVALVSSLAMVGVHAWFCLQDAAIGQGGGVWGFFNLLTLTRDYAPNGSTGAGELGFCIGQGFGLVVWAIGAVAVAVAVIRPRDAER